MKNLIISLLCFFPYNCFSQNFSLLITEIFADPTPSKGLPEKEFIELFNSTSKLINLKGFKLIYGKTEVLFPEVLVLPQEYVIVCRKGNEQDFANYGKVIPLNSFSLINEGSLLVLKDEKQNDIFFVTYSSNWYTKGRDQGFSLEMIDLSFPCQGYQNWESSISPLGASPGKKNSVSRNKPDITPPILLSSSLNNFIISLKFDENLSFSTSQIKSKLSLPNLTIKDVKFLPYDYTVLQIELLRKLEQNEELKLELDAIEDCSGNVSQKVIVDFFNLSPPDSSELLISEILFNPHTGGKDYVEFYNNSKNKINLKSWFLSNMDLKGVVGKFEMISTSDLILKPQEFLAITENAKITESQYPTFEKRYIFQSSKIPSFNIDKGTVLLFNPERKEFDRFSYSDNMHTAFIADSKGVSLERINFKIANRIASNWHSASSEVFYGTPGYANSQKAPQVLQDQVYVEPLIFNPYQNSVNNSTYLYYDLEANGQLVSIDVLDKFGISKRKLRNISMVGSQGKIEWDGSGEDGNLLPVGYYFFNVQLTKSNKIETFRRKVVLGSN